MTVEVHATDVAKFANGRKVVSVTKPGMMKVATKTGPATADQPFNVGDVMLVDAAGRAIVTPLSFAGATEIARRVIEGDLRLSTDSQALRALATAVIGFAAQVVAPDRASDAVAAPAEEHA
ncbi:MAG: hypothetical protein E5V25_19360 [Mesorhizobium sp.]|nr:MAG: hypothetical protein E5V25_19360 [Mesorhizobium sp.]